MVQIRLVVFKKNAPLIPKNDVTKPKARLYCNNQLNCDKLKVSLSLSNGFRKPKTDF